ncbi:hypothetical protein C8Q74DRAFT_1363193 [Fomes fomentarius]|nr:hypothetical protein C8Q74DRAFT_1363193 [Fomes fomentarius]
MSDALSETPPVAPALGSSVVGLCVSFLSYGIMLCQALRYFQTYWRSDPWDLKAAVVGIIYYYLVVTYGHPEAMSKSVISLTLVTPIVTLCIIICQFIYVRRAYLFLPHKFRIALALFVAATVLMGLGFACAFTGKLFLDGSFAAFLQYRWLLSVAFAVSAFLDVFIASILSVSLYISRTGIRRTDALVQTLILYAFTTGVLTRPVRIPLFDYKALK